MKPAITPKKNMKKRPKDPLDSSFGFFENIKRL